MSTEAKATKVLSSVLGFPRIGVNRDIKKAVEAYWANKLTVAELQQVAADVRKWNWNTIKTQGVDIIPSGDFTLYDHVLDHSVAFNVIPRRYQGHGLSSLDIMFAMARGRQADGVDVPACEMSKWFDSNYHYVVPEVSDVTEFKLVANPQLSQYQEARAIGVETRPVVLGPLSYLQLSKSSNEAKEGFNKLSLLPKLLPVYIQLLSELKSAGVTSVQIDEPILVLDVASTLATEFTNVYTELAKVAPRIVLATYFGRVGTNINIAVNLPVHALHIDLDREPAQLTDVVTAIASKPLVLSVGVVSGRNIWKADVTAAVRVVKQVVDTLGGERTIVATSSSLLHTPVTLASEKKLATPEWFSFAVEKCAEVALIAAVASGVSDTTTSAALTANQVAISHRREFEAKSDDSVRKRVSSITPAQLTRAAPFAERWTAQAHLNLPKFPTTTIGSFPQTKEIRAARAKHDKGEITAAEYEQFIREEIATVVRFQEKVGLDILVHGEPERNDMVQFFGEQLQGFVFTTHAWVQSYGSRYVRPPIIVSDVSRKDNHAMTVKWSSYAQSLTKLPMKGMLTGPVTILNWSFPRADISRELQCKQLALALRDEVIDLQNAGIRVIQVDEPAIREGLPLRRSDWNVYLTWAVDSFRIATSGVRNDTQIHSHFCYSDFNDIFPSIQQLDADVISIEASKSDMKLLSCFKQYSYKNAIGPGLYDIHSPRVPSQEELQARLSAMYEVLPKNLFFVNPDCGLKTRGWAETEASLTNLVAAAQWARTKYA